MSILSRITTTYFTSNTTTTKNPINPKLQHNRNQEKNQSRSGSEVHLRKLITNLRFSRFKKSNEFGLSSHQGSRSGFFIRVENWSIRKRTSFQLSLTLRSSFQLSLTLRSSFQLSLTLRSSFQLSLTLGRGRYVCYNLIYVDNLKTNYLYTPRMLPTQNLNHCIKMRLRQFSSIFAMLTINENIHFRA